MSMTTKIELTPPYPVGTKKWALVNGKAQEITVAAWIPDIQQPETGQMHIDVEWRPAAEEDGRYFCIHVPLYDTAEELKSAIFDA